MRLTEQPDVREIDLFGTSVRANPYPHYQRLREKEPVHWSTRHSTWVITKYDHALSLLGNPHVRHWGVCQQQTDSENQPQSSFERVVGKWLSLLDPRTHSTLRKLTVEVFEPKALNQIGSMIQELANTLIDRAEHIGSLDVIKGFADPLALTSIGEILGIPAKSRARFQRLAHAMVGRLFETVGAFSKQASGPVGPAEFSAYMQELLRQKRNHLDQDLLSALLNAQCNDNLEEEDIISFLAFFLFAGHENIMNFVGNAVCALASCPCEFSLLRENETLLGAAVEELLRYDSPVQFMAVKISDDIQLAGKTIRPDEQVFVCIGAANRDPERFFEPNRLDFARPNNHHLSFGHGPLTCLGASLARLEGRIAIGSIVRKLRRLVVQGPLVWRRTPPVLRGLESLLLEFDTD